VISQGLLSSEIFLTVSATDAGMSAGEGITDDDALPQFAKVLLLKM